MRQTVHDTSYKVYNNMQLTTNRNDTSYRNWITGKLKKINTEENFLTDFKEKSFMEQYFDKINPKVNGSMEDIVDPSKRKTLLGPGYYNVRNTSNEKLPISYSFDNDTPQLI